ncbi:YchJ family protein [Streptomyces sp. NPDC059247]|uniref:YchJ family protein n=1 Tax=Streptomyces sp. NPDC059247 TaxID=3346790 RepID=UPI0036B58E6B
MSRRKTRPRTSPARAPRAAVPAVTADSPCPCGLDAVYGTCCGRFHTGTAGTAPTAELLMRSRYSAFVVRDAPYLLRTWAPGTRPDGVDFDPGLRWMGLEVESVAHGTPFHQEGTVTFTARYVHGGEPGEMRERSRFARHEGAWVYVDGDVTE